MNNILVLITLSDEGIQKIKANPELPKKEMEFIHNWKKEGVLENFFISVSKKDAVLIFRNMDELDAKARIAILPYYAFMQKTEYHILDKQF